MIFTALSKYFITLKPHNLCLTYGLNVKLLFHLTASGYYVIAPLLMLTSFDFDAISHIHGVSKFQRFDRMMTTWNFVTQGLFFMVQLYLDIKEVETTKCQAFLKLSKLCDIWFISVTFPTSLYVSGFFWSIYYYDRNLIYPEFLDSAIPSWANHCAHTVIAVLVIVQMLLDTYSYKQPMHVLFTCFAIFHGLYVSCLLLTYVQYGEWVYPLFQILDPVTRTVILIACAFLYLIPWYIGKFISALIHNK